MPSSASSHPIGSAEWLHEWDDDRCAVCNAWIGYTMRLYHTRLCPRHAGEVLCPFCGEPEALTCTCK